MKIYIVYGSAGSIPDTAEWNVKAFKRKEVASFFMDQCNKYVTDNTGWGFSKMHPFDSEYIDYICYGGIEYKISSVDYEE